MAVFAASQPRLFPLASLSWRARATVDALLSGADVHPLVLHPLELWRLPMDAEQLMVEEAVSAVVSHLACMDAWSEGTGRRMTTELARWSVQLRHAGIDLVAAIRPVDVRDFVEAPVEQHGAWRDPAASTMRFRIASARLLFRSLRQLHVVLADPTQDMRIDPGAAVGTRPLDDEEELLCRLLSAHTLLETRRPVAWALRPSDGDEC